MEYFEISFFAKGWITISLLFTDNESRESVSSYEILRWLSLFLLLDNLRDFKASSPGVEGSILCLLRSKKLLIKPFFFEPVLIEVNASVNLFYSYVCAKIPYRELLESFYIYIKVNFN